MSLEPTWTTERELMLRKDFKAGLSCKQSAVRMGLTRNMVIAKRWRLGLIATPLRDARTPEEREKIRSEHHALAYWATHRFEPKGCAPGVPEVYDPSDDTSAAKTCVDIRDWHCKWPLEPTAKEANHRTLFCGKAREGKGSFCAKHAARAYTCEEAL